MNLITGVILGSRVSFAPRSNSSFKSKFHCRSDSRVSLIVEVILVFRCEFDYRSDSTFRSDSGLVAGVILDLGVGFSCRDDCAFRSEFDCRSDSGFSSEFDCRSDSGFRSDFDFWSEFDYISYVLV